MNLGPFAGDLLSWLLREWEGKFFISPAYPLPVKISPAGQPSGSFFWKDRI